MAKREKPTEVYLLPLFVENLREALGYSQEKLQALYLQTLCTAIKQEASLLLEKFKNNIDKSYENNKLPNFSVLRRPRKKIINYYLQLKDALKTIEKEATIISQGQYEQIEKVIQESLYNIDSNYMEGAGGGTEIRKVRDILDISKAPSKDKHDELMFILEHCYPKLLSEEEEKYSTFFRKQIIQTPEQILISLFSVKKEPLRKTAAIDTAINLLMTARRGSFGKSPQGSIANKKALEKAYSELFGKMGQVLTKEYKAGGIGQGQSYYIDDTASMGVEHAKSILYLISGLGEEVINQKWNEISENVFQLVVKAEDICERIYNSPIPGHELLSKDNLFVEEFIILFLTDKEIRAVINDISHTNTLGGCDDNE